MATQQTGLDNETQIRELLDTRSAAMRAFDAEKTASVYADDNVQFLLPPPLQYGPGDTSATREGIQKWFDSFGENGTLNHEMKNVTIFAEENLAFAYCLGHMIGKKTDESIDLWYRETFGLRKIDGQWKIVHDHESVPFYMDGSDKAALDLKPE